MKTFFGRVLAVIVGIGLFCMLLFILFSGIVALVGGSSKPQISSGTVLKIDFDVPMRESAMEEETSIFNIEPQTTEYFMDILHAIEKAKDDPKIEGISIEMDMVNDPGTAQLNVLRRALVDFKQSGKFIYAYGNRISQTQYFLATVADSIFHNPLGNLELKGLSSEVLFFKNLGEKYGIEYQIIRHGDYKSAVEPFMRSDLSEENREQLQIMVNQMWDSMVSEIAAARNLSPQQINQVADSLAAFTAQGALSNGLVDALVHESQYHDVLKARLGIDADKDLKYASITDYSSTHLKKTSGDKVAVLYAYGGIMPGDSYTGIQSETYKEEIRKLAQDDKVKAVVLRVNSGGGDANTSEEILYELKKLREKKPVVVSFGDVAASGGYYIAMANDGLIAEPYTITGSIGVLGMIPNFKGLANNIGVTWDKVETNANSVYYSPFNGLKPGAEVMMRNQVEGIYNVFIQHVAEGRNMPLARVDSLGGGRIYTGIEAKRNGLVDDIGYLADAIKLAAQKAEITNYNVKSYPIRPSNMELLLKSMNLSQEVKNQILTSGSPEILKMYMRIDQLTKMNGVQALWPYDFQVK
ncbi:MAG: signal peptide peptidase SppA [Weeksellaceae bacterium]|nr:signal peptide peptidase SppA [Weeksellaceae bacterium]